MFMALTGSLLVAVFVVIFVVAVLAAFLLWSRRASSAYDTRVQSAVPGAMATIVELGGSYVSRNYGTAMVTMRMDIQPTAGAPYRVISEWEVQPTHIVDVQVGRSIPVRVDIQNPKVVFPDVPWAKQYSLDEGIEDDMTND